LLVTVAVLEIAALLAPARQAGAKVMIAGLLTR